MRPQRQHAFSLVELSIVLVILGLLTGGILAGQSLIRAAELRAVNTEFSKYSTAMSSFRDKYFAVPGDFTKATNFWGSLGGTGSDGTCQAIVATGAPTCNGDGDGSMMDYAAGYGTNSYEAGRFWQHLANAGLIEGQYTGSVYVTAVINSDVPGSRIPNAYWTSRTGLNYTVRGGSTVLVSTPIDFGGDYGRSMLSLTNNTRSSTVAGSYVLKPEEAWNIDTKMDDGMPGTGRVMANKGNGTNTNCGSNAGTMTGDTTATYALSVSSKDCHLYFVRAF